MNRMKDEHQNWLTIDDDDAIHVIPEFDYMPHGFPKGDSAELAEMECPCKPKVSTGDADIMFEKPIIIHNSFIHMEKVKDFMNKLGL